MAINDFFFFILSYAAAKYIGAMPAEQQWILLIYQTVIFLIGNWLPVLNPIVSILTNKPYRNATINLFCFCCKNKIAPATNTRS